MIELALLRGGRQTTGAKFREDRVFAEIFDMMLCSYSTSLEVVVGKRIVGYVTRMRPCGQGIVCGGNLRMAVFQVWCGMLALWITPGCVVML